MSQSELNGDALDQLFLRARTFHAWQKRPVSDDLLRRLYELMRWGPTSANLCPARLLFLRTPEAKERLRPALTPGNVDQTMAAPVTAIVATDELFFEKAPKLFPASKGVRDMFASSPTLAKETSFRNGSLQGAYFILAARSLGLDCGPMSGSDNAKVDSEFLAHKPASQAVDQAMPPCQVRSNFLCNLGYGDPAGLYPRGPRLDFDEACLLL